MKCSPLYFLAIVLSISTVILDQTAIPVALPNIAASLHLSAVAERWVINAYLVSLGSFVIVVGKLSDTASKYRLFLLGNLGFLIASFFCAVSTSAVMLISFRVLQGISGAILLPITVLLILQEAKEHEKGRWLGLYASFGSVCFAFGPVFGGWLTHLFTWKSVFLINLPINAAGTLLLYFTASSQLKSVVFSINLSKYGLEFAGFIGLIASFFILIMNPKWSSYTALLIAVLLLSAVTITLCYHRKKEHLIDVSLLKNKVFIKYIVISVCVRLSMASLIFIAIYLERTLKTTPLLTGLLLLPMTLPSVFLSFFIGMLFDKYGPKPLIHTGTFLMALGLCVLATVHGHNQYTMILLGTSLLGLGLPFAVNTVLTGALTGAPANQRGQASSLINLTRQLGTAFGVAIIGGVISYMPLIIQAKKNVILTGFNYGIAAAAFFLIIAFIISLRLPRRVKAI